MTWVRTWSASCARLMGVPDDVSGASASDKDDCLRLFLTCLGFEGGAPTEGLPRSASKHCHADAQILSARAAQTDAAALLLLTADGTASVLLCKNAGAAEEPISTRVAKLSGDTKFPFCWPKPVQSAPHVVSHSLELPA